MGSSFWTAPKVNDKNWEKSDRTRTYSYKV